MREKFLSMSISLAILLSSTVVAISARAADCTQTCVEVRREGGELVITAHRDPVRRKPAPQPSIQSPTKAPSVSTSTRASSPPTPKKTGKPIRKKARPSTSLSDQIREVLPAGSFTLLPRAGALIYEPLLIHSHGCSDFSKTLPILDTTISLRLDPVIYWNWGDGKYESWRGNAVRGAHIYDRPGRYRIEMSCHWGGFFRTPNSSWLPIPDGISSVSSQIVALSRAEVFFTE